MARSRQQILAKITEAVLENRYVVTPHAWKEMRADGLCLRDVESALLSGRIAYEYTDDPRGVRYRVHGLACDLTTEVGVVVRFVQDEQLLIITAFVLGIGKG